MYYPRKISIFRIKFTPNTLVQLNNLRFSIMFKFVTLSILNLSHILQIPDPLFSILSLPLSVPEYGSLILEPCPQNVNHKSAAAATPRSLLDT